ncbi:MAG: peptidylprolyl isomerase [Flavobacteriaceae bacterium TMED121]|nr:MAG: peptidylprolyl isomerase [Flavobacteriaceae bacterium TMED121]
MAVLGQIRQRSFFLIVVIGMALFAFVISGVFDGNSSSTPTDPIAVVNEEEVELTLFRQMVEQAERSYNFSTMQAVNSVWDQMIRLTIFKQEFDRLGIDAGKEQIEMILSKDERIVQDPRFQNESGFFDFGIFTNFVNSLRLENPQAYQNWRSQEESIVAQAKENIYYDLIKSSSGFTELEGENAYHLENDRVNINFISIPFSEVPDSLFKISDSDIRKYVNQNKEKFELEASRKVNYVVFPDLATDEDKSRIRADLEKLKELRVEYNDVSKLADTIQGLKTTQNITEFVEQYSEVPFDSIYLSKGALANDYADILFELKKDDVFGPYQDGEQFKISRFIDRKNGGSIRASHILVSFQGASRANPQIARSKEEAEKIANKYYREARRNPDDFAELATKYSDGPSSSMGGDLGFFQEGTMTEKFFDFCNKSRIGRIGIVETEFGFHIIKVTNKEDVVLIADVVKQIVPSEETSNAVFQKTTQFEMESINLKDFPATSQKYGYEIKEVDQVNILDENLPSMQRQRNVVQWLFSDETKIKDIKRFSLTTGGYVVAQLVDVIPEGSININAIKEEVIQEIIKKSKADYLLETYKSYSSLDSLSVALGKEIETATAVTQKNNVLPGVGSEPYVIGAAFAMKLNQPSALIKGNNGVYMIEVSSREISKNLESYQAYANILKTEENNRISSVIYNALKSTATIEDNRPVYY